MTSWYSSSSDNLTGQHGLFKFLRSKPSVWSTNGEWAGALFASRMSRVKLRTLILDGGRIGCDKLALVSGLIDATGLRKSLSKSIMGSEGNGFSALISLRSS